MLEEDGLGMEDGRAAIEVAEGVDRVLGDVDGSDDEPLILLDSRRRLEHRPVYQVSEVTFPHEEDCLEVARFNNPIALTESSRVELQVLWELFVPLESLVVEVIQGTNGVGVHVVALIAVAV